jgi:hypothetical protein
VAMRGSSAAQHEECHQEQRGVSTQGTSAGHPHRLLLRSYVSNHSK